MGQHLFTFIDRLLTLPQWAVRTNANSTPGTAPSASPIEQGCSRSLLIGSATGSDYQIYVIGGFGVERYDHRTKQLAMGNAAPYRRAFERGFMN
jgi:hypothetical protein